VEVIPILLKDIELLEKVQRRTTKYILSDFHSDYKTAQIGIFPLMYIYEIADVLFFIKSIKNPSVKFGILSYISLILSYILASTLGTRSAGSHINPITNSYSYHLPGLWNVLPILSLYKQLNSN